MTKKYIIISIVFTGVFLTLLAFGLSSSWAQGFLKTPRERALEVHDREMAECKKTERPLECLMEKEQQREEERRKNMTPEERRQSEEGEQKIKEQWAEIERFMEEERRNPRPVPTPDPTDPHWGKIYEGGNELVTTMLKTYPTNQTTLLVDNNPVSISAGSLRGNVSQGVVYIVTGFQSPIETYPAPSKTGPLKIVSVDKNSGIIELVSIAGDWTGRSEETGEIETTHTSGGARYTFNIKTRKFQ